MKERPILFSAPMVRSILGGSKTQTRRALRYQPSATPHAYRVSLDAAGKKPVIAATWISGEPDDDSCCICPYGVPGDCLWVREAFIHEPAEYEWTASVSIPCRPAFTTYRADVEGDSRGAGWKPSIHMPRHLSRITLEVTCVRVERLNVISGPDAFAEGVQIPCAADTRQPLLRISGHPSPSEFSAKHPRDWTVDDYARFEYADVWETINGAGSWAANPWVWVVEFKRVLQ